MLIMGSKRYPANYIVSTNNFFPLKFYQIILMAILRERNRTKCNRALKEKNVYTAQCLHCSKRIGKLDVKLFRISFRI